MGGGNDITAAKKMRGYGVDWKGGDAAIGGNGTHDEGSAGAFEHGEWLKIA